MNNFLDAPVIEPFRRLLRSRRFTTAITSVLVSTLASFVPGLESISTELFVVINASGLALIAGYSWEDASTAARVESDAANATLREAVRDAVIVAISDIDFVTDEEIRIPVATDVTDQPEQSEQ